MSTDPLNAAVGRIDAAIAGDAPVQSALGQTRDLADLAAVLGRIEALIATGLPEEPDGSAAAERLADIAFVLHEREVEPSLCDALDAAVREISDATALQRASAGRAQQAAELLRELSRRVSEMATLPQSEPTAEAAAGPAVGNACDDGGDDEETSEDDIPRAGLFDEDVPEDDDFAQVVAALAAALPSLADLEELPEPEPAEEVGTAAADMPAAADDLDTVVEAQPDDAPWVQSEAEGPTFAADVEVTLIVESSQSALPGDEAVIPEPPREDTPAEDIPVNESAALQVRYEEAADGMQETSFTPAPFSQTAIDSLSSQPEMNETLTAEQALSGAVPVDASPTSNQGVGIKAGGDSASPDSAIEDRQGTEEAVAHELQADASSVKLETALPLPEALPADDSTLIPDRREPISTYELVPPDEVSAALVADGGHPAESAVEAAVAESADTQLETLSPTEPVAESASDVTASAHSPMAEEATRPLAEAKAKQSRAPLIEPPPIGPKDDPGDLFESEAPREKQAELAKTIITPEPGAMTEAPLSTRVAENEADLSRGPALDGEPAARVTGTGTADQKLTQDTSASMPAPSARQDVRLAETAAVPPPQQRAVANIAVPRSVTNDPLASVRALSEEEMIALFS